jgi:hypothetical protein
MEGKIRPVASPSLSCFLTAAAMRGRVGWQFPVSYSVIRTGIGGDHEFP